MYRYPNNIDEKEAYQHSLNYIYFLSIIILWENTLQDFACTKTLGLIIISNVVISTRLLQFHINN